MQEIKAKIPVILFKEGKNVIAYSPALDLSSCGPTEETARERFAEAARLFLAETAKMGTLDDVMKECGWRKAPNKQGWQPPIYTSTEESVNIPAGT